MYDYPKVIQYQEFNSNALPVSLTCNPFQNKRKIYDFIDNGSYWNFKKGG